MLKLMVITLALSLGPVQAQKVDKAPKLTVEDRMTWDAMMDRLQVYGQLRKREDIRTFPKCFARVGEMYDWQTGEALDPYTGAPRCK